MGILLSDRRSEPAGRQGHKRLLRGVEEDEEAASSTWGWDGSASDDTSSNTKAQHEGDKLAILPYKRAGAPRHFGDEAHNSISKAEPENVARGAAMTKEECRRKII